MKRRVKYFSRLFSFFISMFLMITMLPITAHADGKVHNIDYTLLLRGGNAYKFYPTGVQELIKISDFNIDVKMDEDNHYIYVFDGLNIVSSGYIALLMQDTNAKIQLTEGSVNTL